MGGGGGGKIFLILFCINLFFVISSSEALEVAGNDPKHSRPLPVVAPIIGKITKTEPFTISFFIHRTSI